MAWTSHPARPHIRAKHGLTRTWQSVDLFNDLSVAENLAVAATEPSWTRTLRELVRNGRKTAPAVEQLMVDVGIESMADLMPEELSEGQRKLVGVVELSPGHRSSYVLTSQQLASTPTRAPNWEFV